MAPRRSIVPCPSGFQHLDVLLPNRKLPTHVTRGVAGVTSPVARPVAAVMSLNVLPGGYAACRARLMSGCAGERTSAFQSSADRLCESDVGVGRGPGRQNERLPGPRVERDDRARAVARERLLGDPLCRRVDREDERVAGSRLHDGAAAPGVELAARRVADPVLAAVPAPDLQLVAALRSRPPRRCHPRSSRAAPWSRAPSPRSGRRGRARASRTRRPDTGAWRSPPP